MVVTDDAYRRTRQFLNQVLRRYGVEVTTVPAGDYDALEEAVRRTTRLVFSESPTNPYNRIVDLERLAEIGPPPPGEDGHRLDLRDARSTSGRSSSASTWSSTRPPSTSAATTTCWPASCWGAATWWAPSAICSSVTGAVPDPFAAIC